MAVRPPGPRPWRAGWACSSRRARPCTSCARPWRGIVAEVAFLPRRLRVLHATNSSLHPPSFMNRQNPHSPSSSSSSPSLPASAATSTTTVSLAPSAPAWSLFVGGEGEAATGSVVGGTEAVVGSGGRGGGGGDSHGAKVLWLRDRSAAATRGAKLKPTWVNS
jgi:hypothetical protein